MFDRFREKAIKVMMYASEESRRFGHDSVGTEMILMGLIAENTGIAADALKSVGFSYKQGIVEVEKLIGWGKGSVPEEIPFTRRVKTVLLSVRDEADKLQSENIDTEHVLLGLISEANKSIEDGNPGGAYRVLKMCDVDLDALRAKVLELIGTKR